MLSHLYPEFSAKLTNKSIKFGEKHGSQKFNVCHCLRSDVKKKKITSRLNSQLWYFREYFREVVLKPLGHGGR